MWRILLFLCISSFISSHSFCQKKSASKILQSSRNSVSENQQIIQQINDLKFQILQQKRVGFDKFLQTSLFIDAAIGSANNLQTLILKESYRNKIASLNNPTSNELGFNLEIEIQNALKPLMLKTNKTNTGKFSQVISSFLNVGKNSFSLFPAGNVFTSILSLTGNLTVQEKGIEQKDFDTFVKGIEKYFNQYERLYQSNLTFNSDMENLKIKLRLLQDDIKLLLQDMVLRMDNNLKRDQLKRLSNEELMLKYFDNRTIEQTINNSTSAPQYPLDAIKTSKDIANNIKRTYDEYVSIYNNNFKEIKSIVTDTRNVSEMVNATQLNKTIKDLETLYTESKNMDTENLRLKTLFDRLETLSQ